MWGGNYYVPSPKKKRYFASPFARPNFRKSVTCVSNLFPHHDIEITVKVNRGGDILLKFRAHCNGTGRPRVGIAIIRVGVQHYVWLQKTWLPFCEKSFSKSSITGFNFRYANCVYINSVILGNPSSGYTHLVGCRSRRAIQRDPLWKTANCWFNIFLLNSSSAAAPGPIFHIQSTEHPHQKYEYRSSK